MKKFFTFITLVITLSISTQSYAIDPGFYIGAGGSIAHEEFDIEDEDFGYSIDIDDTNGINLKVGYRVNDISSWEFNFDYLPGFEYNGETTYLGYPITVDIEGDIMTYILVSKISPNFGSEDIRPFIVAGLGIMHGKVDVDVMVAGYSISVSEFDTDLCAKFGLGIDLFVKENISIGAEGSYIFGFGDMDGFKYMNYIFGVAYYF